MSAPCCGRCGLNAGERPAVLAQGPDGWLCADGTGCDDGSHPAVIAEADPALLLFGSLILRRRKDRNWSVRDVAARSGVGLHTISRAERGIGNVGLSSAVKLASALEIELCALVPGAGHVTPCPVCGDYPPAGFACNTCHRGESR